ncbi:uncharacterized protein LOC119651809 isoform X2 [Hermetia illucens]|uniref:uncharacterized protein LOC119651809 isoform X2 n=1 Tax=Hermetia illucens TaxID=343691 RepID=UPI0018CC57A5|nr:uncharacterized protein LOC119651809 isoform X2 [Hermetia illucens]
MICWGSQMVAMDWITFVTVIIVGNSVACAAVAVNSTDHVCFREETVTELIRVPVQQEVKVRSSSWCLEIPPRCSNYKTEMREVIKLQNVTKTKSIEYCCEGYAEITSGNETICKPICRGGCGRGVCHIPNECHCDPGYIGRHCTHRCQHGRWGEGCRYICKCRNGALCDNRTGKCRCTDGWLGDQCDQPCSEGFFGAKCENHCECSSKRCDPATGECIPEDGVLPADTPETRQKETVPASHPSTNSTSLIIETLNSSIANLTENIDKLAKNLNHSSTIAPVTVIVPNALMEVTTIKTVHEVIVIKPNDAMAGATIVVPVDHERQGTSFVDRHNPMIRKTGNSDIIHVTGNWHQHHLTNYPTGNNTKDVNSYGAEMDSKEATYRVNSDSGVNAVLVVIAIFSMAILACSVGFLVLYRRRLKKMQSQTHNGGADGNGGMTKDEVLAKPLPDLPAFTQNLTRQSYGKCSRILRSTFE